jgi:hypothetical protein
MNDTTTARLLRFWSKEDNMKTLTQRFGLNNVAAVLAVLFAAGAPGAHAASTYVTNGGPGGVEAVIADSGTFDDSAAIGLRYKGREFVNIDNKSAWYWFSNGSDLIAQYGTNPLGATTSSAAGGKASTSFAFGGWTFSQLVTAVAPDKLSVSVSLTNHTGATVNGALWGVGFDPDQDGTGLNTTLNKILGVGNDAAVRATGPISGYSVVLANDTSAGASLISPFVHVGDCCSPVDPADPFFASQAVGFTHLGDDSISLAYNLGDVTNGETVTFGYSYTFAVPEPETYALMLAGLGMIGMLYRRRKEV